MADLESDDLGTRQQSSVVKTFPQICSFWKDENGTYLPPIQKENPYGNVLLVSEPTGTGKSYIIEHAVKMTFSTLLPLKAIPAIPMTKR